MFLIVKKGTLIEKTVLSIGFRTEKPVCLLGSSDGCRSYADLKTCTKKNLKKLNENPRKRNLKNFFKTDTQTGLPASTNVYNFLSLADDNFL